MKKLLFLFGSLLIVYLTQSANPYVIQNGQTIYFDIDITTGDAYITYPGSNSWSPTWSGFVQPSGEVIIPSTIDYEGVEYSVTKIGEYAFGGLYGYSDCCTSITSVVLPSTIRIIERGSFIGCTSLSSINIPSSVIEIGANAFERTSLESIFIPSSVVSIGAAAFSNCNINTIMIPFSVQTIGNGAFTSITNLYYGGNAAGSPWGATYHFRYYFSDDDLFYADSAKHYLCGCRENVTNLNVPETVFEITNNAFSNSEIAEVSFPNTLRVIGSGAFSECTNLTSVDIPNSVTTIKPNTFQFCTSLSSLTLPATITEIGEEAFSYTGITSLTIPSSVELIGTNAFANCAIQTLHYNADSCYLNGAAFGTQLSDVSFGSNVRYIPAYAFQNCSGLSNINLPNQLLEIGEYAFENTGLTSIGIPNSVQSMGVSVFANCNNLNTVTIGNSLRVIPYRAFEDCTSLVSLNIPDNVVTVGGSAFMGCISMTSVVFGDGVTNIEEDAFRDCSRLISIRFGDGLENIENNAFRDCGIIGELIFPQNVLGIDHGAFAGCYGITEITCLGRVAPFISNEDGEYYYAVGYGYEYSKATFSGIDSNIVVNVPCGSYNLYAGRWSYFHNFSESAFLFNVVSENLSKGTVTVVSAPTCSNPVATILATPRSGYRFDHWSDGSTENPYYYTVTGSMTLTAYFASAGGTEGIDDITSDNIKIYSRGREIVIEGAENSDALIYDLMGRIVHKGSIEGPIRVNNMGVYMVKIGGRQPQKVVVR